VAASLYQVARLAGFDVTVIDDREAFANRERFPEAHQVIAEDFEKAAAQLTPSEYSYIVIVTRATATICECCAGRADASALRRHDWIQTKDHHHLQRAAAGGSARAPVRPRSRSDRTGYRRHHSRGNRRLDHRELIANRRKVERDLPHMSWFRRQKREPEVEPKP